jgi:hypothetical protein
MQPDLASDHVWQSIANRVVDRSDNVRHQLPQIFARFHVLSPDPWLCHSDFLHSLG